MNRHVCNRLRAGSFIRWQFTDRRGTVLYEFRQSGIYYLIEIEGAKVAILSLYEILEVSSQRVLVVLVHLCWQHKSLSAYKRVVIYFLTCDE